MTPKLVKREKRIPKKKTLILSIERLNQRNKSFMKSTRSCSTNQLLDKAQALVTKIDDDHLDEGATILP